MLKACAIALAILACAAAQSQAAVTVLLARHAEVSGPGDDPSLSPDGQARAELLAQMLRDTPVDAIYVSDLKRTQQTAQAVAAGHHIEMKKMSDPRDVAAAIRARRAGVALVIGHSNTVPEIIALLGGPSWQIGQGEFDNLFILTISRGQTSAIRLHYGKPSPAPPLADRGGSRSSIVQISFVKSGGFAGPMTRVQGTIDLSGNQARITGDATYHRQLASNETEMLRAGAQPSLLSQAAATLASAQSAGPGAADTEQYTVHVKTADGKDHEITLHTSGSDADLKGVPPETARFLSWLQQEAQNILREKVKSR